MAKYRVTSAAVLPTVEESTIVYSEFDVTASEASFKIFNSADVAVFAIEPGSNTYTIEIDWVDTDGAYAGASSVQPLDVDIGSAVFAGSDGNITNSYTYTSPTSQTNQGTATFTWGKVLSDGSTIVASKGVQVNADAATPANTFESTVFGTITSTQIDVTTTFSTNSNLRYRYGVVGGSIDNYTAEDTTGSYSVHGLDITGLTAGTDYEIYTQSSNDGVTWFDVAGPFYQSTASSGTTTDDVIFPYAYTSNTQTIADTDSIPTSLSVGETWTSPDTGVIARRISSGDGEGVYTSRGAWNKSMTMYMLQDGKIFDAVTHAYLLNTNLGTSHVAWSRKYDNVRYGRNGSNQLACEVISGTTSTVTLVVDQNGNNVAMDKLGDSKGDISIDDRLIAIDDNGYTMLYEFTSQYVVNFLGSYSQTSGYTSHNGVMPSPDGNYLAVFDQTAPTRSTRLYDRYGNFIKNMKGCENRSQHGDWGVDTEGHSVWIPAEAETPFYYIPDLDLAVIFELDTMSSGDGRFGNGYTSGQCWPLMPGWAFVSSTEEVPDRIVARVKLERTTTAHSIQVPDANNGGNTTLTGVKAVTYVEPWFAGTGSDTGELTIRPDGKALIFDVGSNEYAHHVELPKSTVA